MRSLHKTLVFTAITAGLLLSHPGKVISSGLRLNDQTGRLGDRVEYTIWIEKSPKLVAAFGFDLRYNSRVLRYLGSFYQGDLVGGFDFFDVNNPDPGTVRAGGFTVNPIPAGSSGHLVTLEFEVIGSYNTSLYFTALQDDFSGIPARMGQFTFNDSPEESSTSTSNFVENQSANQESTSEANSKTSTPFGSMERQSGAEKNPFGSAINPSSGWGSKGDDEKHQTMARVWKTSREIPNSNKEKPMKSKMIDVPHSLPKSSISKRAHDSPSYGVKSFKVKDIEGEKVFQGSNASERVLHFIFIFCFIGLAGVVVVWILLSGEQRL